jgi:hypothetical protein
MEGSDDNNAPRTVSGTARLDGRGGLEATGSAIAYAIGEAKGHGDAGGDDHGRGEVHATGHATTQAPLTLGTGVALGVGAASAEGKRTTEAEHPQWAREQVIVALKKVFPPNGLRPKGRSVKWVTNSLNKLPEFKDTPVSEDTVDRALKDIKAALDEK